MNAQKKIFLLTAIMTFIVIVLEATTIAILYNTAINVEKSRLLETAKGQARLIEGIARFDSIYSNDYPLGAREATLSQIKEAHTNYKGFGETGEFTLSQKVDDKIIFLLSHRHFDLDKPKPVLWDSVLAEPMRRALSGYSGVMIGLDYRGETVLAAHEPVAVLNLGIVAKIDIDEIRAPFVKASIITAIIAVFLIILGVTLFFKITNPILERLNDTVEKLQKALSEVKTLRGILPICSFCKKIRNDEGYWDQVEVYFKKKSDADFSHSICPECVEKNYPKIHNRISKGKN